MLDFGRCLDINDRPTRGREDVAPVVYQLPNYGALCGLAYVWEPSAKTEAPPVFYSPNMTENRRELLRFDR